MLGWLNLYLTYPRLWRINKLVQMILQSKYLYIDREPKKCLEVVMLVLSTTRRHNLFHCKAGHPLQQTLVPLMLIVFRMGELTIRMYALKREETKKHLQN